MYRRLLAKSGLAYAPGMAKSPQPGEYIVQGGDTLLGLAEKTGVSVQEIQRINKINTLTAGHTIKIPSAQALEAGKKLVFSTIPKSGYATGQNEWATLTGPDGKVRMGPNTALSPNTQPTNSMMTDITNALTGGGAPGPASGVSALRGSVFQPPSSYYGALSNFGGVTGRAVNKGVPAPQAGQAGQAGQFDWSSAGAHRIFTTPTSPTTTPTTTATTATTTPTTTKLDTGRRTSQFGLAEIPKSAVDFNKQYTDWATGKKGAFDPKIGDYTPISPPPVVSLHDVNALERVDKINYMHRDKTKFTQDRTSVYDQLRATGYNYNPIAKQFEYTGTTASSQTMINGVPATVNDKGQLVYTAGRLSKGQPMTAQDIYNKYGLGKNRSWITQTGGVYTPPGPTTSSASSPMTWSIGG